MENIHRFQDSQFLLLSIFEFTLLKVFGTSLLCSSNRLDCNFCINVNKSSSFGGTVIACCCLTNFNLFSFVCSSCLFVIKLLL
jgi:hypothetical protein